MTDTLPQKESFGQSARDAASPVISAVVTAGQRLKTGVSTNRDEMLILLGTLLFVVAMALVGTLLINLG